MELTPRLIEEGWPLSGVSVGDVLRDRGEGMGRIVQAVDSREGRFVYKVAAPWKTQEALERDLGLFDFFAAKGFFHAPSLLKTREGRAFKEVEGKFVYLLTYVPGKTPEPTAENFAALGLVVAELNALEGCPCRTEFDPNIVIARELPANAGKLPFKDAYLEVVRSLPRFADLPLALIHNDLSLDNAVLAEDGSLVLLDWDEAGAGMRVLDSSFLLVQHFVSEDLEFQEDNARAFYRAYFSKITFTPKEREYIFPSALLIALMYVIYGDTDKRWKRIRWALENRPLLESVLS